MTIDEARALMQQWMASPALRVHMECVAACMGSYAEKLQPDQKDRWIVCGLLHDMDYEKHTTPAEHTFIAVEHLHGVGVDDDILHAILGHDEQGNTPHATPTA